jgi:hypothetical protein
MFMTRGQCSYRVDNGEPSNASAGLSHPSFAIMPAADGGPMLFLISAPHIRAAVSGPSTHKQVSTFRQPGLD